MSANQILGLVMLFMMVPTIFIGFPISFTLLFLALVFGYIGMGPTVFDLMFFQTIGMMDEGGDACRRRRCPLRRRRSSDCRPAPAAPGR